MTVRKGELSKSESTQLKGIAILFMVALHLFCRKTDLPYADVTVWGVPLSYFFGLFGDQCVAIYCFCSGYAHGLLRAAAADTRTYVNASLRRLLRFLVNFWIVVLTFSIVGLLAHSPDIPQSISALIGNLFLYDLSYNGAWWFVLTYCLMTLLSPLLYRLCKRVHPILITGFFFVVYVAGYARRFKGFLDLGSPVPDWFTFQLALLGTSLFPYMIGMTAYERKWITALRGFAERKRVPPHLLRVGALAAAVGMMALHRLFEALFFAVFISFVTIVLFAVVPITKPGSRVLEFFGKHSMNIWLTHMFFYLTLFRDFVFIARWPIPIFLLMLAVCVGTSYVLQWMQNGAQKLVKKIS